MPRSSSAIEWESLKPKILHLLSAGKTQNDVIEEISGGELSITKSQLEYKLKRWGRRTHLTAEAWKFVSHRIKKRGTQRKSAVFFNGALIPYTKVTKETSRHVRPTMLPEFGGSPKCPQGFELIICTPASLATLTPPNGLSHLSEWHHSLPKHDVSISSLPWVKLFRGLQGVLESSSISLNSIMLDLTSLPLPAPSQFPGTLIELCGMKNTRFGLEQLDKPYMALSEFSDHGQAVEGEVVPRRVLPFESQVSMLLGLQIFQISNKLSTDLELRRLGNTVKIISQTTPDWKTFLTESAGVTSRALIEQLFAFSITSRDNHLVKLMLQIGAKPNQQVFDSKLGMYLSALDCSLAHGCDNIANLLLDSGAVSGQMSLKHAIVAQDLDTAKRLLRYDQSLDLDFNYLDTLHPTNLYILRHVKLEKATLLGLVSLDMCNRPCFCRYRLGPTYSHFSDCARHASIVCLDFLIQKGATITLDTMILASYNGDVATLQFLMQHGGIVDKENAFGFSCFDAAVLRNELQYEVLSLLLASGATTNITRTHRATRIHRLLLVRGEKYVKSDDIKCRKFDQLIELASDANHRIRQVGSPAELALAHEKFLWSRSIHDGTPADLIADSKAESPLEYAIILGCESVACTLINRPCLLTGRELKLAAKVGSVSILNALIERDQSRFHKDRIGRTTLKLGLRWGHETIVQYLLGKGVKLGPYDIMDALQYPGKSVLSTKTQMALIKATPELDQLQTFGLSLLELCSLKFKREPLREILRRFPTAFDSGALSAIAIRVLNCQALDSDYLTIGDLRNIASRRHGNNREWEKENTAVLTAAMCHIFGTEVLHILVPSGTTCAVNTTRLPKRLFSLLLEHRNTAEHHLMDRTHSLGCQDWVSCSPLIGLALTPALEASVTEGMLDHLLACSYEPDALTVVMAASRGNVFLLRRLACLENWESILSIDDDRRPPWCPTALQAAVPHWNEELVEFLLEAGTSVNEAAADEPIGNHLPRTALQAAIDKGSLKLMNRFIEAGACVNAPAGEDSGATALQLACIHGYLTISIRLLELGADVNARGALKNGRTALEGAAEHGRIDTIQLLLNHGVCTEGAYREQYLKAVLYAESNRHFTAAALLKEHRQWGAEDEECFRNLRLSGLDKE